MFCLQDGLMDGRTFFLLTESDVGLFGFLRICLRCTREISSKARSSVSSYFSSGQFLILVVAVCSRGFILFFRFPLVPMEFDSSSTGKSRIGRKER